MSFNPPLTAAEVLAAFNGRYRNICEVHRGGQAAVFCAEDGAATRVAVKIYYPGLKHMDERSDLEVAALSGLTSASIVQLHDAGDVRIRGELCPFIATSFIEGEVLRERIRRGPLPVADVLRIGVDVATAIQELWQHERVHRDLSPNNIMCRASGGAVVIDLGLVRHVTAPGVTTAGVAWGTRGYLSPEQAQARPLTCKADVFTLGVVIVEALLGAHPTPGDHSRLSGIVPQLPQLLTNCPPNLVALLQRMLHREAARRPMPDVVHSELRSLLGGGVPTP